MIRFVVFFLFLLGITLSVFSQASYKYTVTVPQQFISKAHLSLATDPIPNLGRYVVPTGYEVLLNLPNAENYVKAVFETAGIPVLDVTGDKGYAVFDLDKAGGNNCEQAQILCSNTSQTANSTGPGTQELTGANQGCLYGENQSSWYYLNVQTGGTLNLTIDPQNNSDDYDFAIWGPFTATTANANCPPVSAPIRCSYSAESDLTGLGPFWGMTSLFGCGFLGLSSCYGWLMPTDNSEDSFGDSWVAPLTTTAGQIYILLVDNYSNSGSPYNMSFGGTTVLGCTPVVLPVELSSFSTDKTSNGNVLKWTTETENRSDYFTIDWTTDISSGNWQEIARVSAAGTSEVKQDYSAFHNDPSKSKINYYRLSLTDLDGSKKIFDYHLLSVDNSEGIKHVEKIANLMGQEVAADTKGLVIYCYSDGTTQKVYK